MHSLAKRKFGIPAPRLYKLSPKDFCSDLAPLRIWAVTESLLLCSIRLGISEVDRRLRSTSSQTRIWNISVEILFGYQMSFFEGVDMSHRVG